MPLPELFGSSYITLAIVVVVVILLVLLLFLNIRGKKRASVSATATAGEGGKKSKPAKMRPARGKAAAADDAAESPDYHAEGVPETPEEAPEAVPSHTRASATRQTRADLGAGGVPAADPITTVVSDILRGWGDLTEEDTNRLAVFRMDRVLAAIAVVELPKDLRNSEHARTRLGQLRHYATTVQEGGRKVHLPQAEFAGIGIEPLRGPQPSGEPEGGAEPTEPPAGAAEDIPEAEETAGESRAADASWGVDRSKSLWGEEAAAALWGADTPDTNHFAETAGATGERSLPEIRWEPETPAEIAEKAGTEAGWDNAENAVAAAAAAFWAASEPAEAPAMETPAAKETVAEEVLPVVEEFTGFEEDVHAAGAVEKDTFFSSLGGKISTAEDLLALPATEQANMLVFLEPAELDKVFRAVGDPELKKSVIDTLEHVGSPASLDVIHKCLDDPDPSVQVHALEAADRLLGAS
jgi:hypothetical protein